MPFTPLHWGLPFISARVLFREREERYIIAFFAVILTSIPDIEGFFHLVLGVRWIPLHGPLHSVGGVILIGAVGSLVIYPIFHKIGLKNDFHVHIFLIATPLLFHLGIDLFMHSDLELFWPLAYSPVIATPASAEAVNVLSFYFTFVGAIWFIAELPIETRKIREGILAKGD